MFNGVARRAVPWWWRCRRCLFFFLHGRPERSAGFRGKLTNAAIYATCRFHPQAAETGRRCQPGGRGRQRRSVGDWRRLQRYLGSDLRPRLRSVPGLLSPSARFEVGEADFERRAPVRTRNRGKYRRVWTAIKMFNPLLNSLLQ